MLTDYEVQRLRSAYELAMSDASADDYTQEQYVLYGTYNPFSVTVTHILNNKSGVGLHQLLPHGSSCGGLRRGRGRECLRRLLRQHRNLPEDGFPAERKVSDRQKKAGGNSPPVFLPFMKR